MHLVKRPKSLARLLVRDRAIIGSNKEGMAVLTAQFAGNGATWEMQTMCDFPSLQDPQKLPLY